MTFYAALDVSLDKTVVCVMGRDGSIVATCPETLARSGWSAAWLNMGWRQF